jgi:hypothetical protein
MDRREMLRRAGYGFVALPEWLAVGFGLQEPRARRELPQRPGRAEFLLDAAHRALSEGKPLLVFVAPRLTRDAVMRERNAMFPWALAHWLSRDEPAWLLDLGLFVPAVGSAADLKAAFGLDLQQDLGPEEPRLLWIDVLALGTGAEPRVRSQRIEGDVESLAELRQRRSRSAFDPRFGRESYAAAAATLAQHLSRAIACRGEAVLDELAARVRARLDAASSAELGRWLTGGEAVTAELLQRATAELRLLLRGLPPNVREPRLATLARAIRTSLGQSRIPGSAWGWSTACGIACENPRTKDEEMMGAAACGIPHANHQAKRFLFLYLPPATKG